MSPLQRRSRGSHTQRCIDLPAPKILWGFNRDLNHCNEPPIVYSLEKCVQRLVIIGSYQYVLRFKPWGWESQNHPASPLGLNLTRRKDCKLMQNSCAHIYTDIHRYPYFAQKHQGCQVYVKSQGGTYIKYKLLAICRTFNNQTSSGYLWQYAVSAHVNRDEPRKMDVEGGVFLGQSARWAWDASISRALVAIAPGEWHRGLVMTCQRNFGWTLTILDLLNGCTVCVG